MNKELKKGAEIFVIFPGSKKDKNKVTVEQFSQDKQWVHLKLATGGETWREIKDVEVVS